ncbi:hypothetical protein LARI1_G008252 [Lachnellula arida]|uniref:non-specific serine/threonine protein kinase n=1 Tax=Lachnellula arida TaxID=1316785 RepID=A0A8T9B846_9HELO|nr:hypothetical protein LARI1_G008252 [Lachnellula arida]
MLCGLSFQQLLLQLSKTTCDLILALANEPAARILPSRTDDRTLSRDFGILYSRVDANRVNTASSIPLVELIVRNEPGTPTSDDADIWRTVFELIAHTNSPTPPAAFEKAVFDTPLRSSSASQRGIEQTHDEVDQRICEELTGRVFDNVGGFFERYFEGNAWTNNARDIYEVSRAQYAEGRWSRWPEVAVQGLFFEWFMKFQDTVLSGLGRRYYTSANKVLTDSEADRKLDIFLTSVDDGKILHRDISENNIIITEAATKGDPKGMLIDLDLAKEVDSLPSGASHRTGTMQFMAIEVLQGKGHTYRHDLESFFMSSHRCAFTMVTKMLGKLLAHIGQGQKRQRDRYLQADCGDGTLAHTPKLRETSWWTWIKTDLKTSLRNLHHGSKTKRLARELRSALFPIRDGAIFTATFRNNDTMYEGMIDAFSRAIGRLRIEEQAIA